MKLLKTLPCPECEKPIASITDIANTWNATPNATVLCPFCGPHSSIVPARCGILGFVNWRLKVAGEQGA